MLYFDPKNPVVTPVADGAVVGWMLAAKNPYKTWGVRIAYPVDMEPKILMERLAAEGFVEDAEFARIPAFNGIQEVELYKDGSDIFGEWSPQESRANMRGLNKVFRDLGFNPPAKYKLTMADLI